MGLAKSDTDSTPLQSSDALVSLFTRLLQGCLQGCYKVVTRLLPCQLHTCNQVVTRL